MLSQDEPTARRVEQAMAGCYARLGLEAHTYVTTVNKQGVWLLD